MPKPAHVVLDLCGEAPPVAYAVVVVVNIMPFELDGGSSVAWDGSIAENAGIVSRTVQPPSVWQFARNSEIGVTTLKHAHSMSGGARWFCIAIIPFMKYLLS